MLTIGPSNINEIEIRPFASMKINMKMSFAKFWPFRSGFDVWFSPLCFSWDTDLRTRHTTWTQSFGYLFNFLYLYGLNQMTVQRYLILPTKRDAILYVHILLSIDIQLPVLKSNLPPKSICFLFNWFIVYSYFIDKVLALSNSCYCYNYILSFLDLKKNGHNETVCYIWSTIKPNGTQK